MVLAHGHAGAKYIMVINLSNAQILLFTIISYIL